jgi:hypothetical protein
MNRAAFIVVVFAVALSLTSADYYDPSTYESTGSEPAEAFQSWHREDSNIPPMTEVAETSGPEVLVAMSLMRGSAERENLMQDGTAFHINKKDRGHMSKKMKRQRRSKAFIADGLQKHMHDKMMRQEEKVRTEDDKVEDHSKGGKLDVTLATALRECNDLKKDTYWQCDRAVCSYHMQCSGKREKLECHEETLERKHKEVKSKQMEKWNKIHAKMRKKKLKELAKKGVIQAEKTAKKEKVYKSPKAVHERKIKKKAEMHTKEIKRKVKKKYEKEIKGWAHNYGGASTEGLVQDVAVITSGAKRFVNEEKIEKAITKKYQKEKHAKAALAKLQGSPKCKKLDDHSFNKCRTITKKAYVQCYDILKRAGHQYTQHKLAKKMLKSINRKHNEQAISKHHRDVKRAKGKKGKAKGKKHGKKHGKFKKHLKKLHGKAKKIAKALKKGVKHLVKKVAESKTVLKDEHQVKKYSMKASEALKRAGALEKRKDFADATAYAKLAVHLSAKRVKASLKTADDEEKKASKAGKKKKSKKKKVASLYQQQSSLYQDDLSPKSLYDLQKADFEQALGGSYP